ncbi:MAG: 4-(cytidine 5'-diphospho)-2-C-methyl-D-erythritol kinase [Alphaproteobacteria bacterium]|nr:4-(cytidine 5'-diphospho)-2-C-methyl-D-erythritol kinase [Alphaproteobacteria bacterium]
MIKGFAPAKVNLALHVTGQRADGLHLLDSLVCFADVGDEVSVTPSAQFTLSVEGADGLAAGDDNLVLKAARCFGANAGARIRLNKKLPVAAGLGGGSADAACTLRLLSKLWQLDLPAAADILALGADVPVCLTGRSARMQGIGEAITPLENMPPFAAVLVNPGVAVPTQSVFNSLKSKDNSPLNPIPNSENPADWIAYISMLRNDLEVPALQIAPVIDRVLERLGSSERCAIARMSGSGASCFGLFETREAAQLSAQKIRALEPDWWVVDCWLGGSAHT